MCNSIGMTDFSVGAGNSGGMLWGLVVGKQRVENDTDFTGG